MRRLPRTTGRHFLSFPPKAAFISTAGTALTPTHARAKVLAWYAAPGFDLVEVQRLLTQPGTGDATLRLLASRDGPAPSAARWHFTLYPAPDGAPPQHEKVKAKATNPNPSAPSPSPVPAPAASPAPNPAPATGANPTAGQAGGKDQRANRSAGDAAYNKGSGRPVLLCATAATPDGEHAGAIGPHRSTVVFFADGGLVGWSTTWAQLVGLRQAVESAVLLSTNTTLDLPLRTALVETMSYDTYDSFLHRRNAATTSRSTQSAAKDSHERAQTEDAAEQGLGQGAGSSLVVEAGDEERHFIEAATDTIVIGSDTDDRSKIAFSYALAQSVKLDAVDIALTPISLEVKRWQQSLAASGKLLCTVKKLRQAKTHTLTLLEYLNFKHHIQTTPKMFWTHDYQHLRGVYRQACEHLEIPDRGESVKQKLDTVDGSVTYLHHEVHASSNEVLTWIIIVLISLELLHALGADVWMVRTGVAWVRGTPSPPPTPPPPPLDNRESALLQ